MAEMTQQKEYRDSTESLRSGPAEMLLHDARLYRDWPALPECGVSWMGERVAPGLERVPAPVSKPEAADSRALVPPAASVAPERVAGQQAAVAAESGPVPSSLYYRKRWPKALG